MLTDRECNELSVDLGEVHRDDATYTPFGRPVAAGERRHSVGHPEATLPFRVLQERLERERGA